MRQQLGDGLDVDETEHVRSESRAKVAVNEKGLNNEAIFSPSKLNQNLFLAKFWPNKHYTKCLIGVLRGLLWQVRADINFNLLKIRTIT